MLKKDHIGYNSTVIWIKCTLREKHPNRGKYGPEKNPYLDTFHTVYGMKCIIMKLPSKHSSWWRRLEDVLKTSFVFVFRRRLDQDEYVRLSLTSSEDVLVKTNIFVLAIRLQDVFTTFSRRLQDVFKTSCKKVFKTSSRRPQDVLKTSSKRLQDVLKNVFKTSSRRLQDVLQRYLQDVFKTYHQVKLFLLTRLWEAFNTFLRRSFPKTIICRGICPGNTTSDKFMVSVQNLQER